MPGRSCREPRHGNQIGSQGYSSEKVTSARVSWETAEFLARTSISVHALGRLGPTSLAPFGAGLPNTMILHGWPCLGARRINIVIIETLTDQLTRRMSLLWLVPGQGIHLQPVAPLRPVSRWGEVTLTGSWSVPLGLTVVTGRSHDSFPVMRCHKIGTAAYPHRD